MEINKPDCGLFKGVGKLELNAQINKKYFPKVRNIHQFQYTHHHKNDYLTSFQRFFSTNKSQINALPEKVKHVSNNSTLLLGDDNKNYYNSLSKTDYRRFEKVIPPKQIKHKQQGIGFGDESKVDKAHFMTTAMEKFSSRDVKQPLKVTFKDRGAQRFNPITGEHRTLNFGFQDFAMGRKNNYHANNVTHIPVNGQKFDIINGRKLTFN